MTSLVVGRFTCSAKEVTEADTKICQITFKQENKEAATVTLSLQRKDDTSKFSIVSSSWNIEEPLDWSKIMSASFFENVVLKGQSEVEFVFDRHGKETNDINITTLLEM
jgi:hypothetical protein